MTTAITRYILESYVTCKQKGYLALTGENGTVSDYDLFDGQLRSGPCP